MLLSFFDLTNLAVAKSGSVLWVSLCPRDAVSSLGGSGARGVQVDLLLSSSQLEEFSLTGHAGEGYFCGGGRCSGFFAGSWFQVRHPPLGCAHITGPTTMAYLAGVMCYAEFLTLGSGFTTNPDSIRAKSVAETCSFPEVLVTLWLPGL